MGSSPCRRLSLLGIAHPVVGKTFQVLEVHQEKALHEALVEKKVKHGLFCVFKSGKKTRFLLYTELLSSFCKCSVR